MVSQQIYMSNRRIFMSILDIIYIFNKTTKMEYPYLIKTSVCKIYLYSAISLLVHLDRKQTFIKKHNFYDHLIGAKVRLFIKIVNLLYGISINICLPITK